MYIAKFQVTNYKGIYDSQEIALTPGFNVIVGSNDVGKTALVEAMSLQFSNNPHRSMKTVPRRGTKISETSKVNVAYHLSVGEAEQLLIDDGSNFYVPVDSRPGDESITFQSLLYQSGLLRCHFQPSASFASAYLEAYGSKTNAQNSVMFSVDISEHKLKNQTPTIHDRNSNPKYGIALANILRQRIYMFKAERLNLSRYGFGMDTTLSSDARNLALVLHNLQSKNLSRFRRLSEYISIIFPKIKGITVPPDPQNGGIQVYIWPINLDSERDDLAVPLSDSGTGIGQVLAILYVVLTSEFPQTIIIDEPQSFLNPGAVRKLMEILKQHAQHQYIITTHFPEIVSITNPETLFLLRKEEAETIIECLDSSEARSQQLCLMEVGARLSDVFGADNILWVEGPTEEQCFPLLVEKILRMPLQGTKILGVVQTGDFESRYSELIFQVYERLTRGDGLIPPAIGFIFDQEGRSQQVQRDLKKRSQDRVVFLPRRMYENYLLNTTAIASVVSQIENFRDTPVSSEEIGDWLQHHYLDRKYYSANNYEADTEDDRWIQTVHGAKLLADIFKEFSDCRVEYDKVIYGLALTRWLVENAPGDLVEVADIIRSRLELIL
jgi:AAA15 family ATPase/GTPase